MIAISVKYKDGREENIAYESREKADLAVMLMGACSEVESAKVIGNSR